MKIIHQFGKMRLIQYENGVYDMQHSGGLFGRVPEPVEYAQWFGKVLSSMGVKGEDPVEEMAGDDIGDSAQGEVKALLMDCDDTYEFLKEGIE